MPAAARHYVRGSHTADGFRPHGRTGTLGFSQGITDFGTDADRTGDQACPAAPGTLMMHGSHTIHWAIPNRSATRSRRALGFISYAERARFDAAASGAYHKRLASELSAVGRI